MCRSCNKCNTEYCENIEEHFFKRNTSKDGLATICKYCSLKNRHKENHINEENHILCCKCKEYKAEDDFDIANNNWFRKNRDRRCKKCKKEQYTKRLLSNKGNQGIDRLITERYAGLKDRAKKNGLLVDFDREYLKELWENQNHKCALSGIEMTTTFFQGRTLTNISVDRIDSSKGYIKENVQLVCMAINQMKSDMSKEELINFCKLIINYND